MQSYFDDVAYRFYLNNALTDAPTGVLLMVLLVLTVSAIAGSLWWANRRYDLFTHFTGEVDATGMRRIWVFNPQPYAKVGACFLAVLVSFVGAVAAIIVTGLLVYGLLWALRLLLFVLVWVGYISLIIGVLALLGKESSGCAFAFFGGIIVSMKDSIRSFGDSIVAWGFSFMNQLNLFEWIKGFFVSLWDALLLTLASPFLLFGAIALAIVLVVLVLMGAEWLVMRIYSVRRPCPVCGSTQTPSYMVKGKKHPAPLHPGVYGILHHTNPATGQRVPTMLFNGKGRLERVCPNCGHHTKTDGLYAFGTEVHIGIVGNRSSGKSYLVYSALSQLQQRLGENLQQTDAAADTRIASNAQRIQAGAGIQTVEKDAYRAIQLMLKAPRHPMPYHLFFYDVAGETFNLATDASRTALQFYANVQTIVYVLDPTMTDYSTLAPSQALRQWLQAGHASAETYNPEATLSNLHQILEKNGRAAKSIDLFVVCAKADLGYLAATSCRSDEAGVRRFVTAEMGLHNFAAVAAATFRTVAFRAVSATEPTRTQAGAFLAEVLAQRKVNI